MDAEARIRLRAKRFNETLKLTVTTLNAVALVVFVASVIQPLTQAADAPGLHAVNWSWFLVAVVLHVSAQTIIRLIRLE